MRRFLTYIVPLPLLLLAGCSTVGDKAQSLTVIYGIMAVLALFMLIAYCAVTKKKNAWYLLLFTSVLVVNTGYFALAASHNLTQALNANRLAYLGSVFLPLSICMIIVNVTRVHCPKWLPKLLVALGVVMFLVAASPGYLSIYYKEVTFQKINGVTVLEKVYGPLHGLYLFYLLGYFAAMVTTIVRATLKGKIESVAYAAILAIAVFVNIGVWLIEQLSRIDFEILSVSYIISEGFLLGLNLLMTEQERRVQANVPAPEPAPSATADQVDREALTLFQDGVCRLTPTERTIYGQYISGSSTKQIMEQLNITENTLKFHNKNIYSKLGVSSRKQLIQIHSQLDK